MLSLELCLFFGMLLFIVCFELFVLSNLLFDVSNGLLESRFLERLGFLVRIDLLESYELFEGLARVFSNDGVDFGGCVLERAQLV